MLGALGIACGTLACGESQEERAPADSLQSATERSAASETGADFEHLSALGYVDWDEGADASLSGAIFHQPERVSPGFNLYTNDVDEAYVCDLEGRILHTWRLPQAQRLETFELMADGGVVVVSSQQLLARLDRDSNVLWFHRIKVHHDVRQLPDGSFLAPYSGPGRRYNGRRVRFDGLQRVSADGELLSTWFTWDHLEELQAIHPASHLDHPPDPARPHAPPDKGTYDYYHLNSVERLGDTQLGRRDARFQEGNLLVCLRNVDLVCVLDGESLQPVWWWGAGVLELPHMPTLLENGHLIVFDNGAWRGSSRAVEMDPETGEVLWTYGGSPPESFFSRWRGSAQRLPNGNTLICEAERGHVVEVDPAGELVWEFWNPEFREGERKRFYRFLRVDRARVAAALDGPAGTELREMGRR